MLDATAVVVGWVVAGAALVAVVVGTGVVGEVAVVVDPIVGTGVAGIVRPGSRVTVDELHAVATTSAAALRAAVVHQRRRRSGEIAVLIDRRPYPARR